MAAVARAKDSSGKAIYNVKGIDIKSPLGIQRINSINKGLFPFDASDNELVNVIKKAHKEKRISASYNLTDMETVEVIIINIPLDISYKKRKPFVNFYNAILDVENYMNPEALVVIEITRPPRTSEKKIVPILLKCFNNRGVYQKKLTLAHSYERVIPGPKYLSSIINNWRVYSGYNKKSLDLWETFLKIIINYKKFLFTRLASMTASFVLEQSY